ncbi:hypothetical protein QAD02_005817 [Eretmocerus hayati]|uniref:Uncharacterized protein n=1 Tax=Eretmocerus hayati TaxID=131215 RepID=A0ACC2NTK6_9HYME|nr:hypothetical protein QAD02_005817 [Eretmocerus hayati]
MKLLKILGQYSSGQFLKGHRNSSEMQIDMAPESILLYEVVRPVFNIIRLMGMAPYDLPRTGIISMHRSTSLFYRNAYVLYSVIPMSIYSVLVRMILARFEVTENDAKLGTDADTLVSKFFITLYAMLFSIKTLITMLVNFVVLLTEIVNSIITADKMIIVWNCIQNFDRSVRLDRTLMPCPSDPETPNLLIGQLTYNLRRGVAIFIVGWTIVSISGLIAYHETIFRNLNYAAAYYGNCIAVFKFCLIAFLLCQRFQYLNDVLLKKSIVGQFKIQDYLFLKETELKYQKLLDASHTLNEANGVFLFLQPLTLFLSIVNNGQFFIYRMLKFNIDEFYCGVCEICWINMFLVQLIMLHIVCDHTTKEVR